MLIAQFSDLHVGRPGDLLAGRVDANAMLARAVERVLAQSPVPEMLWITGDLVAEGRAEEYTALRALLAPLEKAGMGLYLLPGNHDDREALRAAFPEHEYLRDAGVFMQYVVETPPVRLIALDTLIPGEVAGTLCGERLQWLAARLAEAPHRPTVLFMHHPPFPVGMPLDRSMCANQEALGRLLEGHRQVRALFCGHVHRAIQLTWHGVRAGVCPSTAHQFHPELTGRGSTTFTLEPAGFYLHWFPEGGGGDEPIPSDEGPVTHLIPTEDWPGPFPLK